MEEKDVTQIQGIVRDAVVGMLPLIKKECTPTAVAAPYPAVPAVQCPRPYTETGSGEFAEDRTQVNSLANGWGFASGLHTFNSERNAHISRSDALFSRGLEALDENNSLAKKLNAQFLDTQADTRRVIGNIFAQQARHADDNAYVTRYDLSNPVTTGSGDTLRSAAYTPNRATDTANAGQAVNADAVNAAVAKFSDAINPVLIASIGDAIAAGFANMNKITGQNPVPVVPANPTQAAA